MPWVPKTQGSAGDKLRNKDDTGQRWTSIDN
jgi:hypothetical protein